MTAPAELTLETWLRHPHEDVLEEYGFQRLSEPEVERVEEHLLICAVCRDRLEEIDQFMLAMKGLEPAPSPVPAVNPVGTWRMCRDAARAWLATAPARAVMAGGMAVLFAFAFAVRPHYLRQSADGPPVSVTLKSMRGGNPGYSAAAPAKHPLHLTFDVSDLSACAPCRVEIVDAGGRVLWSGSTSINQGQLRATASAKLNVGIYWVRLFTGDADGPAREFSLRLQ